MLACVAIFTCALVPFGSMAPAAHAQSLVSGDISGTVEDPAGAAVVGATVKLTSKETGTTFTTTTSATGAYRFSLLKPGAYTIAVSATGFKETSTSAVIAVGVVATANVQLTVGAASETVEVNAGAQLLQPDSAELSTEFEYEQLQSVPNPGGDITYVAQTAPGAVMNTGGGYGNFEVFGLPATSNNFTMNGMQVNDPFLNLNNSGPSNLLLGLNDVQEVNVVTNAYGVQYGSFGGAQVNAISRSGSNRIHGNADYWWNGRVMNANNWFNAGQPKPFSNSNQWAAAVGGPIVPDHTFFFVNYEGLSFVTAPVDVLFLPSTDYQTAVLGTDGACDNSTSQLFNAGSGAQCAFYKNAFAIYNNVPNHAKAATISTPMGDTPDDQLQLTSTPKTNLNERLITARLDQVFSDKDRLFGHFKYDHGVQPTYTDPFTPTFNANSDQPDYEGQLSWNHTFNQKTVNQFLMTGSWYGAIFKMANPAAAAALMPETVNFSSLDAYFSDLNTDNFVFPQGRNISQDQVGDDLSHSFAKHTLKLGVAYKKDYVSDYDTTVFATPLLLTCGSANSCGGIIGLPLNLFGAGFSLLSIQDFPLTTHVPISLYTLGVYGQDDWKPVPNVTFTLGVRVERNSNPYASKGSLSNFGTDWNTFVSNVGAASATTPYNTMIKAGLKSAFVNYQRVMVEPRFGFTYSPSVGSRTVLRGGVGIFTDVFPGTIADTELTNPPINPQFTIFFGGVDPSQSYSSVQQGAALNATFQSQYAAGGSLATISAANPNFSPPNFTTVASHLQYPTYEEWNFQIQHELARGNAFQISYVGNHGYHEPVQNAALNVADVSAPQPAGDPFPAAPPASAFGSVTEIRSNGSSNYNGLVASYLHKGKSLNMQLNYTWSHALDEISNGGILPFSGSSIANQIDPFNLAHNYGNADYDIRQYFNGNYLYTPHFGGPKAITDGWELSGVIFAHTGLPFSVTQSEFFDSGVENIGGSGIAQVAPAPGVHHHCGASAAKTPCLTLSDFPAANTGDIGALFAPYDRNQFTGPDYFDTDLTFAKSFTFREDVKLKLGITGYNLLNHPNFANPNSDALSSTFGSSLSTVSPPTSIYGAFLGGDASVRIVQFTGKVTF
jgi:hypothetical protein